MRLGVCFHMCAEQPVCPRSKMKMCKLSLGEAQQFYAVHQGRPFYDTLTRFMSAGRIVAMELVRDGKETLPPCKVVRFRV